MVTRIIKNLAAALPLGIVLALWLTLADSFHVVAASVKLLGSVKAMSLLLVYGCLTTQFVTLGLFAVVSIIVTVADVRGRFDTAKHAGRVIGIIVFLLMFGLAFFMLGWPSSNFHLLDPRLTFPMLGFLVVGWLVGRLAASYCGRNYKPENRLRIVGSHYAVTAGLAVFVFGSFMAQYNSLREMIYITGYFSLNLENYLYYLMFIIAGLLSWWVLRLIFKRLAQRSWAHVLGLMAIFIIIPLVIFLRPAPQNNPDKHNPNPGNTGRNVILISIDTLRYDRLGCNGNNEIDTKYIDELADESVIFNNCIVPIPLTLPSHSTMLTGLNPRTHGLRVQDYFLDEKFTTLAEKLSDEGFTCGGFVSMAILRAKNSNLNQGFHYYDDYWIFEDESRIFPPEVKYFFAGKVVNKIFTGRAAVPNRYERRAEFAVDGALKWLDYVKDEDFFCFFHIFDPHWDYNAPEPFKNKYDPDYDETVLDFNRELKHLIWANKIKVDQGDIDHIIARYDGEVTYADQQLGRLFKRLKDLGLWDETMIILTSDHGESFDHDYYFGHADRVYQSCIHVPLIIKPFGGANGEKRDMLVSNADLFPTVCEALGIMPGDEVEGKSLMPILSEAPAEDYVHHPFLFSESYAFDNYNIQHYGKVYGITRGNEKLIYSPFAFPYAPIYQYYDLSDDPDEENNLYDLHTSAADDLFKVLKKWVEEDEKSMQGIFGRIEKENLESLQYLN